MKISKIFHWLYASVMLMPIFAIGVKCLYVTFNPNAKDSYGVSEDFTYYEQVQTQVPSSFNNVGAFNYDNYYQWNDGLYNGDSGIFTDDEFLFIEFTLVSGSFDFDNLSRDSDIDFSSINSNVNVIFNLTYTQFNMYLNVMYISDNSIMEIDCDVDALTVDDVIILVTDFDYDLSDPNLEYVNTVMFSTVEYYITTFEERTITTTTLDDTFYYSVNQISEEPIFSWASTSFLSQPLLFVTNFFGVPSTSPIITIMCYWFSISVIWLVFDLVMYFPLLIHRWLDKGVLE